MRIKKSNCPNCNFDILSSLNNNNINFNEIIILDEYNYINWKNEYNKKKILIITIIIMKIIMKKIKKLMKMMFVMKKIFILILKKMILEII